MGGILIMKPELTEQQEMLRQAVREFVEAEIAPNAAKWDEEDYCP